MKLRIRGRCWAMMMFFKWGRKFGLKDAWEAFCAAWKHAE